MSLPMGRLVVTTSVALFATALAAPAVAAPTAPTLPTAPVATLPAVAAPAGSADNQVGTLTTCYGGAVRDYFQVGGWGGQSGPYRTTTRCGDINVRNASTYGTYACVVFIDKTNNCNYWTYLPANSGWRVAATNVRDGVNFVVRFSNSSYQYGSLVSYHAF
ncbi:hypothetical protein V6U90_05205 [Micromonospora sp. CPCC 206060]|uniref:hypothetical protein n=1 Tax=Micromonospora sp. CPCC 206060 TaxID=3122406 RepID=UPI002FF2E200